MESLRLPRFKRAPVVPIQITERDFQIIRLVHQHRFLHSSNVIGLVDNSRQSILHRLQLLYHQGYLERTRAQIDYYHRGGSRCIIYGLGNKRAALLKLKQGRGIRWGEKNRAVGRIYLEHAVLISDIMVKAELGCRQKQGVRLLLNDELPQIPKSFRWQVKIGAGVKLGVIPDRVFGLETTDKFGNAKRAYFFLEADRQPVLNLQIVARKRAFQCWCIWGQRHRNCLKTFPPKARCSLIS